MANVFIKILLLFPPEGLVYDYRFDDAGLTLPPMEDDEEETIRSSKVTTFTFTLIYSVVLVFKGFECLKYFTCQAYSSALL